MAIDFGTTNANRLNFGTGTQYQLTDAFTIMTWVNPKEVSGYSRIVIQRYYAPDYSMSRNYMLAISTDGKVVLNAHTSNDTATVITSASTLTASVYTHIAVTFDQSYLRMYLNGVLDASVSLTSPLYVATNPNLMIGAQFNVSPCRSNLFDLRIYNTYMSGDMVAGAYAAKGADGLTSGLVLRTCIGDGCVGMGSLSSKKVYDHSSYHNHITATGAPTSIVDPYRLWSGPDE